MISVVLVIFSIFRNMHKKSIKKSFKGKTFVESLDRAVIRIFSNVQCAVLRMKLVPLEPLLRIHLILIRILDPY